MEEAMSAARHHMSLGSIAPDDLLDDIQNDIAAARTAQRGLAAHGRTAEARDMGKAVDSYLDERSKAQNGSWRPEHA
jgi:hypothetical protein